MLNRNFAIALAATMVMAGLYGCSSESYRGERDMYKELSGELQNQLDAANNELTDVKMDLETANNDLTEANNDLTEANNNLTEANNNLTEANNNLTTAQEDLKKAQDDLKEAQDDLKEAQDELADINNPAAPGAHTNDLALDKVLAGVAGSARDETAEVNANTGAVTMTGLEKDMDASPTGVGMWSEATKLTDETNNAVTTAYVYTNREAAKDEVFSKYYTTTASFPGITVTVTTDKDDATVITDIVLGLEGKSLPELDVMMSSSFPTTPNVTQSFVDDLTTTEVNESEIAGTFNGVDGTFYCDVGLSCSVVTDGDGKLSSVTGSWNFKPTSLDSTIMGVVDDMGFTHFGVWMRESPGVEAGDPPTYVVKTIFGGDGDVRGSLATVEGMASYEGSAVGQYVHKTVTPTSALKSAKSGIFTADVNLDITFFGDDIAANKHGMVTGGVTNFMADDGTAINENWKVDFSNTESEALDNGETKTGTGADGTWNAVYYGGDAAENEAPTDVVGDFNANFVNGSAVGAFGAEATK